MDEKLKEKYSILADLIFPDVTETIEDLEKKYPRRDLKEGAYVTRFAPSPTGFLHMGALFTSIIAYKMAKQTGGVFYIRIEDTDKKREVKDSVHELLSGLKYYGITPDEGVIDDNVEIGNYGPYVQSKREKIYKVFAKHLIKQGLAYPCFCTSECLDLIHKEQEKNKVRPGYYSVYARCRNLSVDEYIERVRAKEEYIIRFRSSGSHMKKIAYEDKIKGKIETAQNDQDIVIIKSDNLPTYHFAHIVDDRLMGTTLVIRGEEWIPSTPIHLELFKAFGFKAPKYAHLPSVMIQDGDSKRKLSKRKDKEAAVSYFKDQGYVKEAIIEYLLTIINSDFEMWKSQNKEKDNSLFEIKFSKINSSGALFDINKLNDVSKEVISRFNSEELLKRALEWSEKYDPRIYELLSKDLEYSKKIFSLERDNVKKIRKDIIKLEDIKSIFFYFFNELYEEDISKGYNFELSNDLVKKILSIYINKYNHEDEKDLWFEKVKETTEEIGFCTNMKEYKENIDAYAGCVADVASIIRVAITNRLNSPDLYSIMQIIGKDEVLRRVHKVIDNK